MENEFMLRTPQTTTFPIPNSDDASWEVKFYKADFNRGNEPMFLMPGIQTAEHDVEDLVDYFCQTRDVYVSSLYATSFQVAPEPEYHKERVERFFTAAEELRLGPVALCALDESGATACMIAEQKPGLVDNLFLLDPILSTSSYVADAASILEKRIGSYEDLRTGYHPEDKTAYKVLNLLSQDSALGDKNLQSIKAHTRIYGHEGSSVDPSLLRAMANLIPNCVLSVVDANEAEFVDQVIKLWSDLASDNL